MRRRKITLGDWLRGAGWSIRNGTAMNPFETQRLVNAAHDDRVSRYPAPSRQNGYYSQLGKGGKIDVFIGPDGNITSERPHVHVVHNPSQRGLIITATNAQGVHIDQEFLPESASGNQVNAVVDRLRRRL